MDLEPNPTQVTSEPQEHESSMAGAATNNDTGPSPEQKQIWQHVLTSLIQAPISQPFREPVPWKEWELLNYPEIVKKPMDLSTIQTKLNNNEYPSFEALQDDVQLIVDNCILYNTKSSDIAKAAIKLNKLFFKEASKLIPNINGAAANVPAAGRGRGVYSNEEKEKFCKQVFHLRALDLGKVIELLDEICPAAIERSGMDEIDVNVDVIDGGAYRKLESLVRECLSKDVAAAAVAATTKRKRVKTEEAEAEAENNNEEDEAE